MCVRVAPEHIVRPSDESEGSNQVSHIDNEEILRRAREKVAGLPQERTELPLTEDSFCFAEEVVRSCLENLSKFRIDPSLGWRWMKKEIQQIPNGDESSGKKSFNLDIFVLTGHHILASCTIYCPNGKWKQADALINLLLGKDNTEAAESWKFKCLTDAVGNIWIRSREKSLPQGITPSAKS